MNRDQGQPRLDGRAGRRRRAWELQQQGWKPSAIAAALGVTPGAVSQWLNRARTAGVEAVRRHPASGPTPRLPAPERAPIPAVLARGPEASGFRGQVWTGKRGAEVLRRPWGVTSHPAPVNRLRQALRPSVQRPVDRATPRDERTIAAWWQERWPAWEKQRPTTGGAASG